jgi:signal transduction histidine kinase
MMQHDTAIDAGQPQFVRDVLTVAASNDPLDVAVERLLTLAQTATQAVGGRALLIVEPRLTINVGEGASWNVPDDRIAQTLSDLLPGMLPEPVSFGRNGRRGITAMLAPIAHQQTVIGGALLLFRGGVTPQAVAIMSDLANALSIVAARERDAYARQQQSRFAEVLAALPDPVLLLDSSNQVTYLNRAGVTAFGISALHAEGLPLEAIPGLKTLAEAVENHKLPDIWKRDGTDKAYVPRLIVLETVKVLSLHDVTRYEKLDLNHAAFIESAAHDLRSPLGSTLLTLGLLEDYLSQPDHAHMLPIYKRVENSLRNTIHNFETVLDAGKYDPETGFYQMNRKFVDVPSLIDQIMAGLLLPPDKPLNIASQVADGLPQMNIDPFLIERAVVNLLDNAAKYTPANGSIELVVAQNDGNVLIGVRDNGHGITPAEQRRLFKRYSRLERKEFKKVKGTGLGLFIVRRVAQMHGGDAWVDSAEGQGSTFWLNIPLVKENLAVPQP